MEHHGMGSSMPLFFFSVHIFRYLFMFYLLFLLLLPLLPLTILRSTCIETNHVFQALDFTTRTLSQMLHARREEVSCFATFFFLISFYLLFVLCDGTLFVWKEFMIKKKIFLEKLNGEGERGERGRLSGKRAIRP